MEIQEFNDEWLVVRGNYLTLITPELALEMLERNYNNRKPKERAIAAYARDMAAGAWDPDASDIKFARTGELLDGQNRLYACIRAGVPFATLVRTGLAIHTRAHVDTGVKRTVADMLRMELNIQKNPTTVGAAVLLRVRYEDRVNHHHGRRLSNASAGGRPNQTLVLTHEEVLAYIEEHPMMTTYHATAESMRKRTLPAFPPSAILCFLTMAGEQDEKAMLHFVDRLTEGEFGGTDDPLPKLVHYAAMVRGNVSGGSPGHRGQVLQQSVVLAMTRTWNATRGGEPLRGRLHIKITDRLMLPV
jgi:hypothetical protein